MFTLEKPIFDNDQDWLAAEQKLQANIIRPHGRQFCQIMPFQLNQSLPGLRSQFGAFALQYVTSAAVQRQQSQAVPRDPDSWIGCIYLTASGYAKLGNAAAAFPAPSGDLFRSGLPNSEMDGMLLLASANPQVSAAAAVSAVLTLAALGTAGPASPGAQIYDSNSNPIEHFGYRDGISQPDFTKIPASTVLVKDPFGTTPDSFGSYIAYLKIRQDVAAFNAAVQALATAAGISADVAGAMVVGRFKDGTPLSLSKVPDPNLSSSPMNFKDDLGASPQCPYHSHIRKVRPGPRAPGGTDVQLTIARRGMTYDHEGQKGLLFVSAQANLRHIKRMLNDWINDPKFPRLGTGSDALVGKNSSPQRWLGSNFGGQDVVRDFGRHTEVLQGAYCFAPSMTYLASL